jgi:hypothetical protein
MRLTVGPLPAAVYWRRRLLVLSVLVLVILAIVYACTGGSQAGDQAEPGASDPAASATTDPSATPTDDASGDPAEPATATTTPSPTAPPTPSAFTLPVAAVTGPCTNSELELTASANPSNPTVGVGANFTLKIKNISSRTCVRDIGGAMQELILRQSDGVIVWSSDDCGANNDHFDEEFVPGHERTFTRRWDGYVTRDGTGQPACGLAVKPNTGNYELVARLGDLLSAPAPVDVNSSGA